MTGSGHLNLVVKIREESTLSDARQRALSLDHVLGNNLSASLG